MKKILKNAALLSLCAITFVGCGNSKVDFATFKSKAEEALKTTVEYKEAKITGNAKFGSLTISVDCEATVSGRTLSPKKNSEDGIIYTTLINECGLDSFIASGEITNAEYYAGNTFEVKGSETSSDTSETASYSYAWNENGLLTYINATVGSEYFDIKVSYSK